MLLCLVLALSGWCTFTCFAQATAAKDAHSGCHGGNKDGHHSIAVVQTHPPAILQHSTPAVSDSPSAFSPLLTARLQIKVSAAAPVFRALPALILRL
jgi:hypothetical protein